MISNFMDENEVSPPKDLPELLAWFPAETPEPPVEVSHGELPGELYIQLS